VGVVQGRQPSDAVLHSSREPDELWQFMVLSSESYDDSTINIVLVIIIIIIIIIIIRLFQTRGPLTAKDRSLNVVLVDKTSVSSSLTTI